MLNILKFPEGKPQIDKHGRIQVFRIKPESKKEQTTYKD